MRRDIMFGEGAANLGGIYENAVIQELSAHGYPVYYYNSKKLGELDFVIEHDGGVLPIEVKSGKDYYVHSAVNNVLENMGFGIESAIVFGRYDIAVSGKVTYYPVYMSTFLSEKTEMPILSPVQVSL